MARAGKFFQRHRRDIAEKPIVDALRALGFTVSRLTGKGNPDILVRAKSRSGPNAWGFEVKTGDAGRTAAQEVTEWPIVRSIDDALHEIAPICAECRHVMDGVGGMCSMPPCRCVCRSSGATR